MKFKGAINLELLLVIALLTGVFIFMIGKINEIDYKNTLYEEETIVKNFAQSIAKKLDMASYSKGYFSSFSTDIGSFGALNGKNYTTTIEDRYIVVTVDNRSYFTSYNSMDLLHNDSGVISSPPFELDEGEYYLRNIEGVVYIENT